MLDSIYHMTLNYFEITFLGANITILSLLGGDKGRNKLSRTVFLNLIFDLRVSGSKPLSG